MTIKIAVSLGQVVGFDVMASVASAQWVCRLCEAGGRTTTAGRARDEAVAHLVAGHDGERLPDATAAASHPYFDRLGAAVEELGRVRGALRQVVTLAGDAPQLTDSELRRRLWALAERVGNPPTSTR